MTSRQTHHRRQVTVLLAVIILMAALAGRSAMTGDVVAAVIAVIVAGIYGVAVGLLVEQGPR